MLIEEINCTPSCSQMETKAITMERFTVID